MDSDDYLRHLVQYIRPNPVKAKLVKKPEDWEFSSYPDYVGLCARTLPKMDIMRSHFTSIEAYRVFMERWDTQTPNSIQHLTLDEGRS